MLVSSVRDDSHLLGSRGSLRYRSTAPAVAVMENMSVRGTLGLAIEADLVTSVLDLSNMA